MPSAHPVEAHEIGHLARPDRHVDVAAIALFGDSDDLVQDAFVLHVDAVEGLDFVARLLARALDEQAHCAGHAPSCGPYSGAERSTELETEHCASGDILSHPSKTTALQAVHYQEAARDRGCVRMPEPGKGESFLPSALERVLQVRTRSPGTLAEESLQICKQASGASGSARASAPQNLTEQAPTSGTSTSVRIKSRSS